MSENVEKISQELADIINQSADLEIGEAQGAASPGQQVIARVNNRLITRTATTNVVAGQSVAIGGDAVAGAETGIVEENRREDRWEEEPREPRPGVPEKPPFRLPILFAAAIESESSEDVNLDCKCYSWNYDPQYAENGREDSWKEECIPYRSHPDRPPHGVSAPPLFRWAAYIDTAAGNQVFPGVPFPYGIKQITSGYGAHSLDNNPVPTNPSGWTPKLYHILPGATSQWVTTWMAGVPKVDGLLPEEIYTTNYAQLQYYNPSLYAAKQEYPDAFYFYKDDEGDYRPIYSSTVPYIKTIRNRPVIWNNRYIVVSNSEAATTTAWNRLNSEELYPYFEFLDIEYFEFEGQTYDFLLKRIVKISDFPFQWELIESSFFPQGASEPGINTPRQPTPIDPESGKPLIIKFYIGGTTKEPFELPVKIRSDDAFQGGIAVIENPENLEIMISLKLGICSAQPLDEEAYHYAVTHDESREHRRLAQSFFEYNQKETAEEKEQYFQRLIDWYHHCSEINIFKLKLVPPQEDDENNDAQWKILSHNVFKFPDSPNIPHWSNTITANNQSNEPFRIFSFLNDYQPIKLGIYAFGIYFPNFFELLVHDVFWGGCNPQMLSSIIKMNTTMFSHGKPNDNNFVGFDRNYWFQLGESIASNSSNYNNHKIDLINDPVRSLNPNYPDLPQKSSMIQEDCNYKYKAEEQKHYLWWMPLYQQDINKINEDNDFLFNRPRSARVYQELISNFFGQPLKSLGENNELKQKPIKFELFEFVLVEKDYGFFERNRAWTKWINPLEYNPSNAYIDQNTRFKGPYITPLVTPDGKKDGDLVETKVSIFDAILISPLLQIFTFSQPGWNLSRGVNYPSEEYEQNIKDLIDQYRSDFRGSYYNAGNLNFLGGLEINLTLEATVKSCLAKKVYTVEAWPIKKPEFRTVLILGAAVPTDTTLKNL